MGLWDSVKRLFGGGDAASPDEGKEEREERGGGSAARGGVYRSAPERGEPDAIDPYGKSPVMGYSEDDVRARFFALRRGGISPFFHPDLLPAPDDEFTQLVDRSLVLAGLLTQEELEAIHRTGLEWRKHRHRADHARIVGKAAAGEAVEILKQERAENAKRKKAEARARREARRQAIEQRKREDIIHLGRGVSNRLGDRRSHVEKLQAAGLPVLSGPADIAVALGITIGQLRWLCFHDEASRTSHYHQFTVPKRSGGVRVLAAPMPHLKRAQTFVFDNILRKLEVEEPAHGFIRGRSTVTNARPHVGQDVVVNLDLEGYFPSVTFPRVRGVFEHLGYSPAAATILALLCTECERRPMRYAGQRYHVAIGDRGLPQGACTSPALANQVTKRLDRRLAGLCRAFGWQYTRYADDLTFSAPAGKRAEIPKLLGAVKRLITEEGFTLNPKKGRIQRRGGCQEVTGIVVNDKLGLARTEVRKLRAILHNARKTGLEAQNREGRPHFRAWLQGKLAYLAMIDRDKGTAMLRELEELPS
ncbi:MAG: RNA-directed DNA polymerase [Myxococcales bacterium]|nr:RNA-directed DNA polymerase [Myxococcales bacterium]